MQPKCPSTGGWIKKMWSIYTVEYSVQFSHLVMLDSLWPHGLQHARLPCASPTPGGCSNSWRSSRWCYTIQLLRHIQFFATPWTAAHQASLSITNSRRLLKLMSIESVMPSSHLIICHLFLLPSIFPSIRVFSNESVLCIRWPKYWSFSFSISLSNEYSGLISFRID